MFVSIYFHPERTGNEALRVADREESDFRGLRGVGLQFWVVFLQKRTLKVPNLLKQVVWRLEEEPVGRSGPLGCLGTV